MSLYRKHRPQQFADVVGQEHIKTTLANALKNGTFSHAYVFAGPKGSGKTTTARLLAKALNCTGRDMTQNHEPCEKCTSCLEVTRGNSMDVVEIDAASNRGIDEMRDLREKVKFAPTAGKYKIYVIDECHMLTKEAFNALLKTLEEPPAHAVFVLATTELHKVPATILSRAQLFDFKKAKVEEIIGLLETVVKKEKIKIEPEALELIARLAYGAYRDALTLLDQVSSIEPEKDGVITLAEIQVVLGQATEQSVWDLVEAIAQKERSRALEVINDVYFEGKDLSYFVGEVIELLRKVILEQSGLSSQFEATKEEKAKLSVLTKAFTTQELIQTIQRLTLVISQVKVSVLGQLPLEMAIFELIKEKQESNSVIPDRPAAGSGIQDNSHETIKQSTGKKPPVIPGNEGEESDQEKVISLAPPVISKETKPEIKITANGKSAAESWAEIVKNLRQYNHAIAAMMGDAVVRAEDDELVSLSVKFKFQADQLCSAKIRPTIEKAILDVTGSAKTIECKVDGEIKVKKPVEREEELLSEVKDIFETD